MKNQRVRIGRLQINWNKKPQPVERNLELIKFYTFKDGTNIYTYKVDDLARISGRYLDNVKNTLNFMIQYQAGPEQVKAFAKNIRETLKMGIDNKMDRTDCMVKTYEIAGQMPRLQEYVEDLHKKQWMDLYVMFFVLEGENECLFSPKWNAKKIELLEAESEDVQEIFFSFLETLIQHLSTTYRQDLLNSTVRERELANLAASLTSLTNNQIMKSPLPDGAELESKNTGI